MAPRYTHGDRKILRSAMIAAVPSLLVLFLPTLRAQIADLQQRVTDLKASVAKNKLALAQYTWTEVVTISVRGQERKQERFQVRIGADGKPQKIPLDSEPAAQDNAGGPRGRIRQRVANRKKEELQDYAERMKSLAERYVPPDKDAIQDAYTKGNISITPSAGGPNEVKLVVRNYVKDGDSMTLLIDKDKKALMSIQIASYLDDPKDKVDVAAQFAGLPDGTRHVSTASIEGTAKQLKIATQNSDYRKL